jgi:hypothetical protein
MNPELIYRSLIKEDNTIQTITFINNSYIDELPKLEEFSRATNLTNEACNYILDKLNYKSEISKTKLKNLILIDKVFEEKKFSNKDICSIVSEAIYYDSIISKKSEIPDTLKNIFPELK